MTAQRLPLAIPFSSLSLFLVGLLAVTGIASAQDPNQQPHPWRRAADAPTERSQQPAGDRDSFPADQSVDPNQAPPPPPNYNANQGYGNHDNPRPMPQSYPPPPRNEGYSAPPVLTIHPGTYLTVRVDQFLSSDRNQQGDTFFASLAEPLVVDGVVVAQRGQTVRGRITDAQRAGRVEGTSKLGVELTGLTLVDGQQVNVHSQLVLRNGETSVGRDVGAVATTTALGAIVGASADYGRGAAIGAGAGAAAGILGVLFTRGRPTVISPESLLTFQLEAPVTVATDRAPQAFRYAEARDYGQGGYSSEQRPRAAAPRPLYYPQPYYSPYYGPAYYPSYWGSGFSVFVGPRFSYGGGYYRGSRGFRR